jgi:hypothetical protein
MAEDAKGNKLELGDSVTITLRVTGVFENEAGGNILLESADKAATALGAARLRCDSKLTTRA